MKFTAAAISTFAAMAIANPVALESSDVKPRQLGGVCVTPQLIFKV